MSEEELSKYIIELKELKADLCGNYDRTTGLKIDDLIRRLEKIEVVTLVGNGKPAVLSRLATMETEIVIIKDEIKVLVEHASLIPAIHADINHLKDWRSNELDSRVSVNSQKIGGIYQIVGAVLGVLLGAAITYWTTVNAAIKEVETTPKKEAGIVSGN